MASRKRDCNPEHYIIGSGAYHTMLLVDLMVDNQAFSVVPKPLRVVQLIVINLVFVAFFGAFLWIVLRYESHRAQTQWIIAVAGIGLMTCGLFTWISTHISRKERHLGPWLIIEKATGRVILPRLGHSFDLEQVVHIQYVTSYEVETFHMESSASQNSELNLITYVGGERRRWPIMRVLGTHSTFGKITKQIIRETEVPIVRYKQRYFTSGVEIKDMRTGELI